MKYKYGIKIKYMDFNGYDMKEILYFDKNKRCNDFSFTEVTKLFNDRREVVSYLERYFKKTGIKGSYQGYIKFNMTTLSSIAFNK